MTDDRSAVLAELRDLRTRVPDVTGALVASIDGLLIVHDTRGLQAEQLAAMSAAQLGLGRQFSAAAGQGDYLEAVTRSSHGTLAVFAAGTRALLTVLAGPELNIGRLYHEARPVAARLGTMLAAAGRAEPLSRARANGR